MVCVKIYCTSPEPVSESETVPKFKKKLVDPNQNKNKIIIRMRNTVILYKYGGLPLD
jgi:hypothetical protein